MSKINAAMTLEIEFEISGNFQAGYPATGPSYASAGEPGQPDMIEDAEVTGLFVERVARDRHGLPDYENTVAGTPGAFTKKRYERVDLLAALKPETRAQVLAAMSAAVAHDAEETLLDAAGD